MEQVRSQAANIAKILKDKERTEATASRKNDITFGVVMDDKVIKITMSWGIIKEYSKESLTEYILNQMMEKDQLI